MKNSSVFSKIVINNVNRERWALSKYACRSSKGIRKYPGREPTPDRENIRPIFFHDTDRIIHSLAYSRYIDKTQVFYLFEHDHITHRVLHVQFVSKIGRVIGRFLRLNEDLIEAIALGHDLGHVPYGHDGEKILDTLCKEHSLGCFCHNAQSVKFLTEIEKEGEGLNLSLQVLDGILAHNGEMVMKDYKPAYDKTWDHFEEELSNCFREDGFSEKIVPMTLEGCVVRVADVIAYVGRDIEDAITLNLLQREDLPDEITDVLGDTNDKIINRLILDLTEQSYNKDHLSFSEEIFLALKALKDFNYRRIYFDPRIKTESHKIEKIYRLLFEKYCEDLQNKNSSSDIYKMPSKYRSNTEGKRMVVDFIAGMTDDYFNNQFREYFVPKTYGYSARSEAVKN